MDKINEFLKKHYSECVIKGIKLVQPCKRIECADGFSISVQANKYAYCMPAANKAWPYDSVELGFPNAIDELIELYSEAPGSTNTIYGYVPISIVEYLVEKHGGISNF